MSHNTHKFKEIQYYVRKGVTATELWKFILQSPQYQQAYLQYYPEKEMELKMWRFLLAPKRQKYITDWETTHHTKGTSKANWWDVLFFCPENVRIPAFFFLQKIKPKVNVIPACLKGLKDQSWIVQREAIQILEKLRATEAVPFLLEMLRNKKNRHHVVRALENISLNSPESIPLLVQALRSDEVWLRFYATKMLSNFGEGATCAIPSLLKILDDDDWNTRLQGVIALGKLRLEPSVVIPVLIEKLKKPDGYDGLHPKIVWALGQYKDKAKFYLPLLEELLKEKEPHARRNATWILGSLGNVAKPLAPALIQALSDSDKYVCHNASWALERIGIADLSLIPTYTKAQEERKEQLSHAMTTLLKKFNSSSKLKKESSLKFTIEIFKKMIFKEVHS